MAFDPEAFGLEMVSDVAVKVSGLGVFVVAV